MAYVNFYRGLKEKYDPIIHLDGIFFATDTLEILMNNASFGNTIADITFENNVITITFQDGTIQNVEIPDATQEDSGLMSKEDKEKIDNLPSGDELEADLTDLAESIYYYHASTSISVSPSLIERGVDTSVTITATSSFKDSGANTLTVTNTTDNTDVPITGTTSSSTATVSLNLTTSFRSTAEFDYGITKTATATVTALYPIYTFGSTSSTVDSDTITAGTKSVKNSVSGSYSITLPENLMYFWICVPNNFTVSNVTLSGFDVPMESYITVAVTDKTDYRCYRSTNTNDAGTYTLVVS